jgi:cell division protein FtsQ
MSTALRRRGARRVRVRLPRLRIRLRFVVALAAALALLGGAWMWLQGSSLVAVQRVTITGLSGPDAPQIRSALTAAARAMTTLDVQMSHLNAAVSPYPVVKRISVSTQFPHGMRIVVTEQIPVAVVVTGTASTPVAADGTVLRDASLSAALPSITLTVAPGGTRITGAALSDAQLLGAAPYALLPKVQSASSDATHGLVAQMRNGPAVYFGDGSELGDKWAAAAAVLADSGSAGAAYIDVTDPRRPVAGVGSDGG